MLKQGENNKIITFKLKENNIAYHLFITYTDYETFDAARKNYNMPKL